MKSRSNVFRSSFNFFESQFLICIPRTKRFGFENVWLREANCVDIVRNSWVSSAGSLIQIKLSSCGSDLV